MSWGSCRPRDSTSRSLDRDCGLGQTGQGREKGGKAGSHGADAGRNPAPISSILSGSWEEGICRDNGRHSFPCVAWPMSQPVRVLVCAPISPHLVGEVMASRKWEEAGKVENLR